MKHVEYLEKFDDGTYHYWKSAPIGIDLNNDRFIEIPNGSDYYVKLENGKCNFYNSDLMYFDSRLKDFDNSGDASVFINSKKLWVRNNDDLIVHAELSKVDVTLLERQSQYGCFEDVAFVTQGIIDLLRKCKYDNMPKSHQMALYMIASKMARLVNGDHNHIDSWHDIGGYSKLIENLIGGESE
jgi:hypothetical protein